MAFCTNCGERIADGTAFCTHCGCPVGQGNADQTAVAPQVVPVVQPSPYNAQRVQQTSDGRVPAPSGQPAPRQGMSTSIIVGVCAAVAVVSVGVVLFVTHPWASSSTSLLGESTSSTTGAAGTTGAATSSASAVATSATSSAATTVSTDTSIEKLTEAYEELGSLDTQIRDVATDFNNSYTSADLPTRQSLYTTAMRLQTSVSGLTTTLKSYQESDPTNASKLKTLIQLSNDLQHRIDVIVSAWKIDVGYANPADHVDEICAPISVDNVNGINKYKIDFDDLYPNARP